MLQYTKIPKGGKRKIMLLDMLKLSKEFQALPLHEQDTLARLATQFQDDYRNLYYSPEELEEEYSIAKQHWETLLSLPTTQAYIKQQMAKRVDIAQRKAFLALQAEAQKGNVGAVKEINELSGILSTQDKNKIIVLHRVDRPSPKQENKQEEQVQ